MNNSNKIENILSDVLNITKEEVYNLDIDLNGEVSVVIENLLFNLLNNPNIEEFGRFCSQFNYPPFVLAINPLDTLQFYPSTNSSFDSQIYDHHFHFFTFMSLYKNIMSYSNGTHCEFIHNSKTICYRYINSFTTISESISIALPYLLSNFIPNHWIETALLNLKNKEKDEMVTFNTILSNLSQIISQTSFSSDQLIILLNKYIELISNDPIREFVVTFPNWMPDSSLEIDGKLFQDETHLGAILGISPFNYGHGTFEDLHHSTISINDQLSKLTGKQFEIIRTFLKPSTRRFTLNYLNKAVCVNIKRAALQCDETKVSGFGFSNNVNCILQQLVFKVDLSKVNLDYLNRNASNTDIEHIGRVLADETRVAVDMNDLLKYSHQLTSETLTTETNFHTECFYLSLLSHHISVIGMLRKHKEMAKESKQIKEYIQQLTDLFTSRNQLNHPRAQEELRKLNSELEKADKTFKCLENVLFNEQFLKSALRFYEMAANFLSAHSPTENRFRYLLQFLFENISEILSAMLQSRQDIILLVDSYEYCHLIKLIIDVINNHQQFRSPYLVAKFVKILSIINQIISQGYFHNIKSMLTAQDTYKNVYTSLIKYYIFVEKTGEHSDFYEKFAIRNDISSILVDRWKSEPHFNNLDKELMIRFINLTSNDITYLMDDAIDSVKKLKIAEEQYKTFNRLSPNDQQSVTEQFRQSERIIVSSIILTKSYCGMILELSSRAAHLFMNEEIVDKFTSMLNHIISELVGPKRRELVLQEPEKYNFRPRELVSMFMSIYFNLDCPQFIEAIAKEERYFNDNAIKTIISIIQGKNLILSHQRDRLNSMLNSVVKLREENSIEEKNFDDVPDEYLDPLMYSIMTDPVMIPKSNIVIDRSVIKHHLLNDTCDPFNRQPLKYEDLIPMPELKSNIQEWIRKKRSERNC